MRQHKSVMRQHNTVMRQHNSVMRQHNSVMRQHNCANCNAGNYAREGFQFSVVLGFDFMKICGAR
jgi:hypothetical protein